MAAEDGRFTYENAKADAAAAAAATASVVPDPEPEPEPEVIPESPAAAFPPAKAAKGG